MIVLVPMIESYHTPVLVDAVLDFLSVVPDGVYVDGTLGGGGHAEALLERLSPKGRLIGIDRDPEAIAFARRRLEKHSAAVTFVHDVFSNLEEILQRCGVMNLHGLLLDLGVSSRQLDQPARGFSFRSDERLDMRMDQGWGQDAWHVLNTYGQEQLSRILWEYGEERHARAIARRIVERRHKGILSTSEDLAKAVASVAGGKFLTKSLARVFQAVRIEVNCELKELGLVLEAVPKVLRPGGRIVVIAYHSLEDRMVKERFTAESRRFLPSGHRFIPDRPAEPRLRILTKKPVASGAEEMARNPRARSAKLRAAERI